MRTVPDIMTARWYSGLYVGDARPIARVTVHRPNVKLHRTPENLFANLVFGGGTHPRELPNVKSVSWNRSVDQDVADCTIEFYNTSPLPIGQVPTTEDLDRPGYYTYNYGKTGYSGRWGHKANEWANMLMPDNILRTFEGYGFDPKKAPDFDHNLVQTGEWMIDEVDLSHDGMIVVQCRDIGRMLLDHIAFPPVVPFEAGFKTKDMPKGAYAYPVTFAGMDPDPIINHRTEPQSPAKLQATYRTSSNFPYVGHGSVHGHAPRHAFDSSDASYWLSVGNARPDQGYSFEWIEAGLKAQKVRRIRFKSWKGGHTAYISVHVKGKGYQGSRTVPYNPNHPASAPNGANIRYVQAVAVTGTGWTEVDLGDGYDNVDRVRVCFGGLQHSGIGPYPYRAGVRRFEVFGGPTEKKFTDVITTEIKNYSDYTDIVKLLCAWGGFYWPRQIVHMVGDAGADAKYLNDPEMLRGRIADIRRNRGLPPEPESDEIWVQRIYYAGTHTIAQARTDIDARAAYELGEGAQRLQSDDEYSVWRYPRDDRAMTIKVGRVWGDFRQSGTAGPAPITEDVFDKKPLMDGIAYIRDILGFIFHIDEMGGVVFKPPNIYSVGNTMRTGGPISGVRTNRMVSLDERQILMSSSASISSRNIRERTFISNETGTVGGMATGWNPNPIGMRRVGGWTDQHFENHVECQRMADMISLRQLFSYRSDSVTIPGYPALQVDDQVRIFERVTSEGYIHYISGINSTLDNETGEYTYSVETHWLGEAPYKKWVFDPKMLARETQEYLRGLFE